MMKLITHSLWMPVLILVLSLVACQEDDALDPNDSSDNSTALQPVLGEGDGAFWAINTITTTEQPVVGPIDIELGTALGLVTPDNFERFVDAGTVSVLDRALTRNDNNSYTYIPEVTDPTGLIFPSSFQWSVSGAGDVASFEHTVDFAFPEVEAITSAVKVEKASGYTLTCAGVSGAEGVIFQVGNVLKEVTGNSDSVAFTADELAGVPSGASLVQVAAFTYREETIGGKTYYFGNQTVRSVSVEIE